MGGFWEVFGWIRDGFGDDFGSLEVDFSKIQKNGASRSMSSQVYVGGGFSSQNGAQARQDAPETRPDAPKTRQDAP